jgi:hypothetical protein
VARRSGCRSGARFKLRFGLGDQAVERAGSRGRGTGGRLLTSRLLADRDDLCVDELGQLVDVEPAGTLEERAHARSSDGEGAGRVADPVPKRIAASPRAPNACSVTRECQSRPCTHRDDSAVQRWCVAEDRLQERDNIALAEVGGRDWCARPALGGGEAAAGDARVEAVVAALERVHAGPAPGRRDDHGGQWSGRGRVGGRARSRTGLQVALQTGADDEAILPTP